ncbi:hypothetical protein KCP75_07210 [Salmonella enterica subsp. enterica]|nr:hypothetical protein KCP75_07210 [Salmonella enterica subsp. enterica]
MFYHHGDAGDTTVRETLFSLLRLEAGFQDMKALLQTLCSARVFEQQAKDVWQDKQAMSSPLWQR